MTCYRIKATMAIVFLFVLIVAMTNGSPIHPKKSTGKLSKRFLNHFRYNDYMMQQHPQQRNFMNEVITGHSRQPDRWMDFYNNGASWDHYMSPQLHSHSQMNVHDPHFDVHLSYHDSEDGAQRAAEQQAHHVESYPGEIVSGENSLSKFVAPPVFDGPPDTSSHNRDHINDETRRIVNSPEGQATEEQNTRQLVDSLKSLMTPLKVPDGENGDSNMQAHGSQRDYPTEHETKASSIMDDEHRDAQNEARRTHDDETNFNDGPQNELGNSRGRLEHLNRNNDDNYNRDSDEPFENNRSYEHDGDKSFDNGGDNRENDYSNFHDENRHDNDQIDNYNEHANFHDNEDRPGDDYFSKNIDNIEKFHDDSRGNHDGDDINEDFHQRRYAGDNDEDRYKPNMDDSDNRDNVDKSDFHDNFDSHGNFRENFQTDRDKGDLDNEMEHEDTNFKEHANHFEPRTSVVDQNAIGSPFGKPHPIEMVQDDAGKLKPLTGKEELQKHIFSDARKEEDLKATRKSEHPIGKVEKLLNSTLPRL